MMLIGAARLRLRGVARGLAVKILLTLSTIALLSTVIPSPVAATAPEHLGVSGDHLTIGGDAITAPLVGVDDTTVLPYAVLAFVEGQTLYRGYNQNFPGPTDVIPGIDTSAELWDTYFAFCEHYDLTLVRLGAFDKWATTIQYQAYINHQDAYLSLLSEMCRAAANHSIYVCLVMAGSAEYPVYAFGGSGNALSAASQAFTHYILYCAGTMVALEDEPGLGIFDLWNEPDHDAINTAYWHDDQIAFRTWGKEVANDTAGLSIHPRTMGVAGMGYLFGNDFSSFLNSTGLLGFEVLHRHWYASVDLSSHYTTPQTWAENMGKPLLWGEIGNNTNYPIERWPFAEQTITADGGQAFCTLSLLGTDDYPYTGNIGDLLGAIFEPIIDAFMLSVASAYGLAGIGTGAVVLAVSLVIRNVWLALIGIAAILITLIWIGGLLAL